MPPKAESAAAVAEAIKKNVRICGVLQIWGGDVFRRGDVIYDVKTATAAGDTLRIDLFLKLDGSKEQVVVDAPSNVKVADGSVRIGGAKSITAFGRTFEPRSKKPALLLE